MSQSVILIKAKSYLSKDVSEIARLTVTLHLKKSFLTLYYSNFVLLSLHQSQTKEICHNALHQFVHSYESYDLHCISDRSSGFYLKSSDLCNERYFSQEDKLNINRGGEHSGIGKHTLYSDHAFCKNSICR